MVVQNLPRKERCKSENILLISIIPGPREPKGSMNTYHLKPLVNELRELWQGVVMSLQCPSICSNSSNMYFM